MKKNVIKATAVVFVLSMIAKLIGFFKSVIQASYFGANIYTDAFNVAQGFVGNILYMLTTAVAVAFVPLYIQHKKSNNQKKFASVTITILSLAAIGLTLILILFAPAIVRIIAPTYTGDELKYTIQYFRVLALGLVFSLGTNLYTNLLNAEKIYGFSTVGSIINSVVLITVILLFADKIGIWTLVISVPLSYLIQWMLLSLKGNKYATITFKYGLRDESIKQLVMRSVPILISQATVEINQVIDRALLSSIGQGVVTSVSYSAVLYQFVTTLMGAPLTTVMFTELSEVGANKDYQGMKEILNSCYKVLFLICIPIVIVLYFGSRDVVNIVYGHGKFTDEAVIDCATGLQMYGLCLLPVCVKKVLSNAYYAVNDTKRPMVIGMLEVVMNIGLSVLLVEKFGIHGVVGATAIASFVFIIIMLIDFNLKHVKILTLRDIHSYWKIILATVALLIVMYFFQKISFSNAIIGFAVKTIFVFGAYGIVLLLLKEYTLNTIMKRVITILKRKLPKS